MKKVVVVETLLYESERENERGKYREGKRERRTAGIDETEIKRDRMIREIVEPGQ